MERQSKLTRGFKLVSSQFRKHPDVKIQLPRRADAGACASDVYSPIDVDLLPGERTLIWTDVKAYMQPNEVCIANVRSSHGKPLVRLANTQGWIDQTYYNNEDNEGNIGVFISNEGSEPFEIKQGDRIAQLMFTPFLTPDNDNPIHAERKGGFGSSGK